MREQNKKLFDDKHQLRKISLNADDLILKHDIKLDNRHNLKFVFRWNEPFRIQCADSMKNIYILKEMNETRLERIYADNRLKRFKTKDAENSSTEQTEIHEMLNITPEDSIGAMKKSNNVNRNARIDDEIRSKAARNIAESSDADSQIFEDDVTSNNLSNSKTRDIHARVKPDTRRFNRLVEIENPLSSVERNTSTTAFATIDEISIEKEWNAVEVEEFETYTNDCNFEDFLIASLILRNRPFAISISSKQSTLSVDYAKKKNDDAVAIIENTDFDTFIVVFDLSVSQIFDIFLSSVSFFFYMNHTKL